MLRKTLRVCSIAKQHHGFLYEQNVIDKFKLQKATQYTSPFDAHRGSFNVQIKCMQHGTSVEFGDYMRNKKKTENFILVVGFWKDAKDNIIQEDIFNVNADHFRNNLYYPYDKEMFAEMKLITNGYEDDIIWLEFCKRHRLKWREFNNHIDLRFRRDHKRQKRIQCGVSWKRYNYWFMEEMNKYSHDEFCQMLQL
jgi:hypothetical protein